MESKKKPMTIAEFKAAGYSDLGMESSTPMSAAGRSWWAYRADGTKAGGRASPAGRC